MIEEREFVRKFVEIELPKEPEYRGKITTSVVSWDDPTMKIPQRASLTPQKALELKLKKPSECDVAVFLFWLKFGTPLPTSEYKKDDGSAFASGTEYEFHDAITQNRETGRPEVLVYRCLRKSELDPLDDRSEVEERVSQISAVQGFFEQFTDAAGASKGGINEYRTFEDFKNNFQKHLREIVSEFVAQNRQDDEKHTQLRKKTSKPRFCEKQLRIALRQELNFIDLEFDYSHDWFSPLKAKVEVKNARTPEDSEASELLKALEETENDKLAIVLGYPGSGKSTAMRQYARDLDRRNSKKVPVYVNLRDWSHDSSSEVTVEDLKRFLLTRLEFKNFPSGSVTYEVLENWQENGKFFWIFDSFDEIPAVMDAGEGVQNDVVKNYSRVLSDFVSSGSDNEQGARKGVISSRLERSPILPRSSFNLIEIQPFTDDLIRDAFLRAENVSEDLVDDLFRPPGMLVPLARTPFYHSLISRFVSHNKILPDTVSQLFEDYILRAIQRNNPAISKSQIDEVLSAAEGLSNLLYASEEYGLSVPVNDLLGEEIEGALERHLDVLLKSRILRSGSKSVRTISFAHRRFHEYFLVRYKTKNSIPFDLEWVAQDTRERDSAVLHVEIASSEECDDIAAALWREIESGIENDYEDPKFYRAVNCFRFLVEAFRNRPDALSSVRREMDSFVRLQLGKPSGDIVVGKLAAESIGLLSPTEIERCIELAMFRGDYWIREAAIEACRFLPSVSQSSISHVWLTIALMLPKEFKRELRRLKFIFELSPSLAEISKLIAKKEQDMESWANRKSWICVALVLPAFCYTVLFCLFSSSGVMFLRRSPKVAELNLVRLFSNEPKTINLTYQGGEELFDTLVMIEQTRLRDSETDYEYQNDLKFSQWIETMEKSSHAGLHFARAAFRRPKGKFHLFFLPLFFSLIAVLLAPLFRDDALVFGVSVPWLSICVCVWAICVPFLTSKLSKRNYPLWLADDFSDELKVTSFSVWFRNTFAIPLRSIASFFAGAAIVSLLTFLTQTIYNSFFSGQEKIGFFDAMIYIVYFIAITALPLLLFFAVRFVYRFLCDALNNRRASKKDKHLLDFILSDPIANRTEIAKNFRNLQTGSARLIYVRALSQIDAGPTGDWPGGRPPNMQDEASTLLAQLEARWRGFEK